MALKIFIIRGIKSKVDTSHPFSPDETYLEKSLEVS